MFPAMLSLRDRRCLVVGGGGVAVRKVGTLLAEGARVFVIAPEPAIELVHLAEQGRIALEARAYRAGEASEYALVFATTDEREVNRSVASDAEAAGVWVNVADDQELCSFHVPARVLRGSLQLVVASAGEAPFAVKRLRQLFERHLGQEWQEWLAAAARFRTRVRELGISRTDEEIMYDRFFDATVDARSLRARVPDEKEQERWLEGRGAAPSRPPGPVEVPPAQARDESHKGLVCLVGAGPGDPGLLTLRGKRRLMQADVVVYDRLAEPVLPCELPAGVELHCVGKSAGSHPTPQEEINALLVRLAEEGKRVVRLKGGDPFVFGRGGEEVEALRAAGVPVEVVPGVTAGVAVPAYAGVSVTHRREAVRLTFVTAHECNKSDGPQVRWDLLGRDPHATIVGYMGVTSLPKVTAKLLAAGMDPATPAMLIERGTTSAQRTIAAELRDLPRRSAEAHIEPPALFVIGPSVARSAALDWLHDRPLAGERLLVPAPAAELGEALELAGAEIVETALPPGPAARVVIGALPLTGVIVRDGNDVELLDDERGGPGWDGGVTAWCCGSEAARRARALGWTDIEIVDPAPAAMAAAVARRTRVAVSA
jgi:uroporphyrin-III C-methyltransferase/precorrin-2 dehydrogenase/sirohydrochlorin ferrochelatase